MSTKYDPYDLKSNPGGLFTMYCGKCGYMIESREFVDKCPNCIGKKEIKKSIRSPPTCNGVEIHMSVWILLLSLFSFLVIESIFILLGIHYGDGWVGVQYHSFIERYSK